MGRAGTLFLLVATALALVSGHQATGINFGGSRVLAERFLVNRDQLLDPEAVFEIRYLQYTRLSDLPGSIPPNEIIIRPRLTAAKRLQLLDMGLSNTGEVDKTLFVTPASPQPATSPTLSLKMRLTPRLMPVLWCAQAVSARECNEFGLVSGSAEVKLSADRLVATRFSGPPPTPDGIFAIYNVSGTVMVQVKPVSIDSPYTLPGPSILTFACGANVQCTYETTSTN